MDCSLDDAFESCDNNYHLCTAIELHSGGYGVARANGLAEWDTPVWSQDALNYDHNIDKGLGLCCHNI
jgi:hypothetical protein